jgi:hypothetical protein
LLEVLFFEVLVSYRGEYQDGSLLLARPDDGGGKRFRNVGCLPDYTA